MTKNKTIQPDIRRDQEERNELARNWTEMIGDFYSLSHRIEMI
jgi:hypothetical protein